MPAKRCHLRIPAARRRRPRRFAMLACGWMLIFLAAPASGFVSARPDDEGRVRFDAAPASPVSHEFLGVGGSDTAGSDDADPDEVPARPQSLDRVPMVRFLPMVFTNPHVLRISRQKPVEPRNVILIIGDGMGWAHAEVASLYRHGRRNQLTFQRLPHRAMMQVMDVHGQIPDSASAGTAMATCQKVSGGVISRARPGDGKPMDTVLEAARRSGKSVGLVTTSYLTDATPASFGAHADWRGEDGAIAADYLYRSRPEVLFGGGSAALTPARALEAGYMVSVGRDGMFQLASQAKLGQRVAGVFGSGELPSRQDGRGSLPSLREMTLAALTVLDRNPRGFFLVIEEEGTDSYSHLRDINRTVQAVLDLDDAAGSALSFADGRGDTLLVVTADHETGGLDLLASRRGPRSALPEVRWAHSQHTERPVPIYAAGPGAERVVGWLDNTELAQRILPESIRPVGCTD